MLFWHKTPDACVRVSAASLMILSMVLSRVTLILKELHRFFYERHMQCSKVNLFIEDSTWGIVPHGSNLVF